MMKSHVGVLLAISLFLPATGLGASTCAPFFDFDRRSQVVDQALTYIHDHFEVSQQKSWLGQYLLTRKLNSKTLEKMTAVDDPAPQIKDLYDQLSRFESVSRKQIDPETRWLDQNLFAMGIKSYIQKYAEVSELSPLRKKLVRIFSHRALRFILNPSELPSQVNKEISPDLLAKIALEGTDLHGRELQAAFYKSGQNKVFAYERFRKVYKLVVATVAIYLIEQSWDDSQGQIQEMRKERFIESLDELEKSLEDLDLRLEEQGFYKDS